ncbi:MAG: thioredoxin family protein [candidate division WOR-3 bacterium]|nr:thioredoxin family protein [candidate division WOR-3 bacterium]
MDIKILGPGCPRCQEVAKRTKEVVEEMKIEANIEKITDLKKIMEYKILSTPGLVINGKVKISGKIPTKSQIKEFIEEEFK